MRPRTESCRKQLRNVLKRLELQGISGWIKQKHRRLLARLALEPYIRFDDERDVGGSKSVGQRMPAVPRQYDTKMRNRNIMPIDRVAVIGIGRLDPVDHMSHDLMTEEVVVDPPITASSLWTSKQIAVETAGCREIVHRKGQMKW